MKVDFKLFGRRCILKGGFNRSFSFIVTKEPTADIVGITSRTPDMRHVLFLDYDFVERWIVEEELQLLQDKWGLPPFYLWSTSEEKSEVSDLPFGNYMAINVIKLPVKKIAEIQQETHCDSRYKRMWALSRYKSWVLRMSEKANRPSPKYEGIVGKLRNLNKEVSTAHIEILKKLYPNIDNIPYRNQDNNYQLFLTTYKTASRIKKQELNKIKDIIKNG